MPEIGFQCKLSVNDGAANAQQDFTDHVTVTLPDREVTKHEHASHGQTDHYFRVLAGLVKNGDLKVEMYYSAAQWARVNALLRTEKTWIAKQPDPDGAGPVTPQQFQFTGFVCKMPGQAYERDGITMFSFEVAVSGPWTITGGT